MSAVAAQTDRRFRRAHVKPARRRRSWQALAKPLLIWTAFMGLLAYGVYRASAVAAHAHMLQVEKITVRGNERLSKGEVLAVLNGLRGENLMWTDLDRWRTRLTASPWVRDAALRRSLPSTVDVVISERQPIGIGRISADMYLVDERGVIIDQYGPQYADLDLPIIDGLSAAPAVGGSLPDDGRADLAARVIAAVRSKPAIARRLSQVDVSDLHNASVILSGDHAVIHLGEDQFLTRLQSYVDLAPTLRERVADIDSVDLRFDDRIYVRPTKGSSKVQVRSKKEEVRSRK
ncbi:MAG: Cell division protein FtsQ [Acidobacteria bacterium]|nr:Cell division protein FtsQ [Acidobacteriota bacterium]